MANVNTSLISNFEATPQVKNAAHEYHGVKRVAQGTIALAAGDLSSSESTIESPSVDRVSNLHANFYKIPESLLSIDFTGSGSGEVKGSGNYEYGETATLRAEAGYSSVFFGWWENGSKISWNEEIELLMEGNRKIEAQFEPATIENILKAKYASNP